MAKTALFKHKTPVQIRFKDVDMMGHVNNANCFSYVEDARLKYFSDVIGIDSDWSKQDGLILGHFEIDFKQPIFYQDKISVLTRCSKIGTKSFDLSWQIVKDGGGESEHAVLAEGKVVLVCYDYTSGKSIEISKERIKIIEEYENAIQQAK